MVGMLWVPTVAGAVTASIRTVFVTLEAPGIEKRPLPAVTCVTGQVIVRTPAGSATTVTTRLLLLVIS